MDTPVLQRSCTNLTHYRWMYIVMDARLFQRSCINTMTRMYIMMDVNSNGYTRVSEDLYKQHSTQSVQTT